MKVREEKLRTIIEWSEKNEDVRVLLLTSSLVNPLALVDEFSDLDIEFVFEDNTRPDGKTMFYLHSIGMLPNYQDKGYGSKLLSFIKEYSKEIGCSEMFLITDKGNPRACHVYEKLGGKNDYKDEIVYVYDYEKGDK